MTELVKNKKWQEYALVLKEVLSLQREPVGISLIEGAPVKPPSERVRICKAFIDASGGEKIILTSGNNACFGSSWHLGFHKFKDDSRILQALRKFVVEGEKLFSSYEALDAVLSQTQNTLNNSKSYFTLSPLEFCEKEPQLIIFVCNPNESSRLLALSTFEDGMMPKIKIGGPTCLMALSYPLSAGEINISFYDYTSRKLCNLENDKLLVSIPYKKMHQMIENIDKCSAGRAKLEYPEEFRKIINKNTPRRGQEKP